MPIPPRQLTSQQLAELKSLWGDRRISNAEIARRFGVGVTTLDRWKARYSLPNRRNTPACDEAQLEAVLDALRAAPIQVTEAARRCGLNPAHVRSWQRNPAVSGRIEEAQRECFERMRREIRQRTPPRGGERQRPYSERPKITDPEVERRLRELWANLNLATGQIAEEFGVSDATVRGWVLKLGMPARSRGHRRGPG